MPPVTPTPPNGYNVTAKCDDCAKHITGSLTNRNGSDSTPLLTALATGWGFLHEGHSQIVVASIIPTATPTPTPPGYERITVSAYVQTERDGKLDRSLNYHIVPDNEA